MMKALDKYSGSSISALGNRVNEITLTQTLFFPPNFFWIAICNSFSYVRLDDFHSKIVIFRFYIAYCEDGIAGVTSNESLNAIGLTIVKWGKLFESFIREKKKKLYIKRKHNF